MLDKNSKPLKEGFFSGRVRLDFINTWQRQTLQKKNYMERRISIITAAQLAERSIPRLDCLAEEMNANGDLLTVDPRNLEQSIAQGLGAVIVMIIDGREVPVAISRLSRLISDETGDALGLNQEQRNVLELGSVFVKKDFRSQGLGTRVQGATLAISQEQHANGSQLVIGTTKEIRELGAIAHKFGIRGIAFKPVHHFEYPFVGPLTCVCRPEEPPFGTGCQYGEQCPQRIDRADVPQIVIRSRIPRRQDVNHYDTHIACTMFVSNPETAQKFNDEYAALFGTPENMVRRLKEVGYYG